MPTTVLVVDDSATVRGFVRLVLRGLPVDVLEADDGAPGLERVQASAPALAIVDVNMPVLGGLEFTRKVRADTRPEVRGMKIWLLTGDGGDARDEGLAAGADDVLQKPLKPAELQAAVKRFLGEA